MGTNVEIAKFENAVDKAAADWALDVTKLIHQMGEDVRDSTSALLKKLRAIPAPKGAPDKDFAQLGKRVNEIIEQDASRLKGIVDLHVSVDVDAKAKALRYTGFALGGKVIDLRF